MDISKCYDSVNLEKLYHYIRERDTFKELYIINNYFKVMRNKRFYFDKKE